MRLLIDTLIVVMLAAILAGLVIQHQQENRKGQNLDAIHDCLGRLREQVYYRGALGEVPLSPHGLPRVVSPLWFKEGIPFNTLVSGRQPWIDLADDNDMRDEPADPVIRRGDQAGFWYNANLGVFRARVMPQETMSETLKLYNAINGTAVADLVERPVTPKPNDYIALDSLEKADPSDPDAAVTFKPVVKHKVPTLRDQDP